MNSGERYGGRIALTFEPSDNFSITPRIVYQKIEADGFNRQEIFNLYGNRFTTTRPQVTFDEREQYLLLREAFEDETLIADATIKIGFGGAELTSVTSYIDRSILVSRDASALTGSVSVDLGFPMPQSYCPRTCAIPPSSKPSPRNCAWRQIMTDHSNGCSAVSIRKSTASMRSACRPPAMTPLPTPRFGRGYVGSCCQWLSGRFAVQFRPAL